MCLSAAAVLVAGCGTSSSVTAGPDPLKCQIALSAPPMMVEAAGGTGTLSVTTNPECAWTATSPAPWISLSPSSGQGSASVEFRVAPNDSNAPRNGNVVVNSEQLRVSQRAPCRFEISPATHNMSSVGANGQVRVSTSNDCAWTATTDASWILLTSPVSGSGNGAVTFVVEANNASERTGHIVIGGQPSTVTQLAVNVPTSPSPSPSPTPGPQPPTSTPCTFAISSTSLTLSADSRVGSVAVSTQSGCAWTAVSSAAWITVTSGSSGTGNGSVAFAVSANTGPTRTGSLTIAGRVFAITQFSGCVYTLSKREEHAGANEGSASVDVSTTNAACGWTAGSNNSWLIIQSGSSGVGNGQVTYYIGENTGGARSGSLTVAGISFGVLQDGP